MKKKGTILMIIGLLLIAAALALLIYNKIDNDRAEREAQKVLDELSVMIENNAQDRQSDAEREAEQLRELQNRMLTATVDGYDYIGQLIIPDADISLPVMDTWDYTRLEIALCRYTGTYYKNDLIICGHNYHPFSNIKTLDIGADVYLITVSGRTIHYTVSNREEIQPTAIDQMTGGSDEWDLTLFTCNFSGTVRCAVRCIRAADLISE